MKKMLLISVALLALGAAVASAATTGKLNLSYNVCRTATTGVSDFVWGGVDCLDPANAGTAAVLAASFKSDASVPNTVTIGTTVDVVTAGPIAPNSFWDIVVLDPQNPPCHGGGISPAGVIGGTGNPAAPAGCLNPYGTTGNQNTSAGAFQAGPNRLRWSSDHPRSGGLAGTLNASTQYIGSIVFVGWDDAQGSGGTCAGCDQPAALAVNFVDVVDGGGNLLARFEAQDIQQCVTYYGGVGSGGCPGVVPTRNATWGQIKALYR